MSGVERQSARRSVLRLRADEPGAPRVRQADSLAAEEPLELRVNGSSLAVTMRTPGDDMDLLAGFLVGEGVIAARDDLPTMKWCAGATEDGVNTYNVLDATLAAHVAAPAACTERNFFMTSSCGLCGKASIDAVRQKLPFSLASDPLTVTTGWLCEAPDRLREAQQIFDRTGGLHAAGLFDGRTGRLLVVREDVGRHNAVDKVIGWALREDLLPLRGHVLQVSGRASFELVQKAALAGIPLLAAVSAPSSLAVDLALEAGMTLVGFLRGPSMVVYAGEQRITS